MNIDQIIVQLKTFAPIFNGNIAGAADYSVGVRDQTWMPLPAAYVIYGDSEAEPNTSMNELYQRVKETISVVVVVDNSADRRGQEAASNLDIIRASIRSSLLNWRPDWDPANPLANREARGIYEISGEFLDADRARLRYQWTFGLDTTVATEQGWQQPSDPLLEIQVSVPEPTAGQDLKVLDLHLPQ